MRFLSPQARHQLTLQDHGYGASVSRGVPVYSPAFAGTHCAYPRRDGQAELTWVANYILRWFTRLHTVTHPSTNRARRRVTSLITTNALTTTPRHHVISIVFSKSLRLLSLLQMIIIDLTLLDLLPCWLQLTEADQELYKNFPLTVSERWQQEIAETIFDAVNQESDKLEMKRRQKQSEESEENCKCSTPVRDANFL